MNADFRKFESSQKDESRAQSADSSKACKRPKAFIWVSPTHYSLRLCARAQVCSAASCNQRRSQRRAGGHAPLQFLEYLVISCFERRYPKQNTVDRLKSNILAHRLQLTSLLQFKFCIVCVRTKFCLLCYATVETLLLLTKGPMKIKSCTTICETNFKKREGQSLASARQLEMSGSLVGRQKSAHATTRVPCS